MGKAGAIMLVLAMVPAPFALAQFGSGMPSPQAPAGLTVMPPDAPGCAAVLLPEVQPYPPMEPLNADVSARVDLSVGQNGQVVAARIGDGSGDAARDAALLAHVLRNWRYRPLAKDCGGIRLQTRVHFPHITCAPQPLPESQSAPDNVDIQDRPRSVQLEIGVAPDGAVRSTRVSRSSGDAGLDAAAMAHVQAAWRWQPYACKDAEGRPLETVMGVATVNFFYALPDSPPP